jgi:hypothetical protein
MMLICFFAAAWCAPSRRHQIRFSNFLAPCGGTNDGGLKTQSAVWSTRWLSRRGRAAEDGGLEDGCAEVGRHSIAEGFEVVRFI